MNKPDSTGARKKRKRAARRERTEPEYLAWLATWPCLVCNYGAVELHHEPAKMMGSGSDWHDRKTVPLCARHHRGTMVRNIESSMGRHATSRARFEEIYQVDLTTAMNVYSQAYERERRAA